MFINVYKIFGGGWIRTSDALRHTRFPSERTRPLCDASKHFQYFTYKFMSRNALTRSATGGWVIKSRAVFFFSGSANQRCAVVGVARETGIGTFEIFSKALANPSGYLVSKAPEASAKNSRFLEMASCIKVVAIGAKIESTTPIKIKSPPPSLLLSLLLPHHKLLIKKSASKETKTASTTATVESSISR